MQATFWSSSARSTNLDRGERPLAPHQGHRFGDLTLTTNKNDPADPEGDNTGVLADAGGADTTSIPMLSGTTGHVSVELHNDDDDDDFDVVDLELDGEDSDGEGSDVEDSDVQNSDDEDTEVQDSDDDDFDDDETVHADGASIFDSLSDDDIAPNAR